MDLLFTLLVVFGFVAWFAATFPIQHADKVAKGLFMVAAIVWAIGRHGG